jgi:hypothetical protein
MGSAVRRVLVYCLPGQALRSLYGDSNQPFGVRLNSRGDFGASRR